MTSDVLRISVSGAISYHICDKALSERTTSLDPQEITSWEAICVSAPKGAEIKRQIKLQRGNSVGYSRSECCRPVLRRSSGGAAGATKTQKQGRGWCVTCTRGWQLPALAAVTEMQPSGSPGDSVQLGRRSS